MRWSCPHCGVGLAVTDEKLGTGWSFSRCFKCGGFALVRKSDINLIKVDKAPAGENVLLPESSEGLVMGHEATQNLARRLAPKAPEGKPIVRSAQRNSQVSAMAASAVPTISNPPRFSPKPEVRGSSIPAATSALSFGDGLPPPLPNLSSTPLKSRTLSGAVGLAGVCAIASGIYLYIEGQNIWKQTQAGATPEESEEVAENSKPARSNLFAQASLKNKAEVVDQVHQSAMAPNRSPAGVVPTSGPSWIVRAKGKDVMFRGGPGMDFPTVGQMEPGVKYTVSEWKDQWFKITPEENPSLPKKEIHQAAWVRNDAVLMLR